MKKIILLTLFLASCSASQGKMEEQRAAVMKVHDDVMAKMGELSNYELMLEDKAGSVDSNEVNMLVTNLQDAQEAMMLWMESYKEPEEELELFYTDQMKKIQDVAKKMNQSLDDAKTFINK